MADATALVIPITLGDAIAQLTELLGMLIDGRRTVITISHRLTRERHLRVPNRACSVNMLRLAREISRLCGIFPDLVTSLSFDPCPRLTPRVVREFIDACPALERLNLYGARCLGEDDMVYIAKKCPELTYLCISCCFNVTGAWIRRFVQLRPLREISASGCHFGDDAVFAIAETCWGLRRICLDYCDVLDAAVIAIARMCMGLKWISLACCRRITDAAVFALAEHCEYLDYINVKNTRVSEEGHRVVSEVAMRPKPAPLPDYLLDPDRPPTPQQKGAMN